MGCVTDLEGKLEKSMNRTLTNANLEHLLHFIGYGKLDAKIWFLGMEEAGGGEENIRARLKFSRVMDCANAHKKILGITKFHTGDKTIQRTWRGMCYIMLRRKGKPIDRESIRNYQADYLGRSHGDSLLCELMPIPKPNTHAWGYETLIPQFESREDYYKKVKPCRVEYLQGLIQEYRPKVVIGYGKGYWPAYRELFPKLEFRECGQCSVACGAKTTVILTHHFARMSNDKLEEVVSIIEKSRARAKK